MTLEAVATRLHQHHLVERELSSELVQCCSQISQTHGVPTMHLYLALMRVLLCRLLAIDDICIGVMSHGRDPTSRFGATVGHVANIIQVAYDYRVGESVRASIGDCSMDVEEVAYTSLYDLTIDVSDSKSNGHMINIRCSDAFYTTSSADIEHAWPQTLPERFEQVVASFPDRWRSKRATRPSGTVNCND